MGTITTGKVRFSFVNVFKARAGLDGGEPKYSITLLIPKSDTATLQNINAAMEQAVQEGITGSFGGSRPPRLNLPLYDGDGVRPSGEAFGEECKGHMVMTASSLQQPSVVDINVQPILNQSELYSGCYGRVSLRFYSYNKNGNKGVGCGLGNIQKIADGDPLSGRTSAADDFGGSNAYQAGVQQSAYPPVQQQYQAPIQQPQQMYQQPVQQMQQQYQAPMQQQMQPIQQPTQQMYQQIDPITGMPITGGVMGL